jgi:hypothetical protein
MSVRVIFGGAATALTLAFSAPVAQANNFFPGTLPSGDFTLETNGSTHAGVGSRNVTVVAPNPPSGGTFSTGGFSVKVGSDNFIAWCLDLFDTLSLPSTYKVNNTSPFDDGQPVITLAIRNNLQALFNTAYDSFLGAGLPNNDASAGFQLALWEIVYETSGTFNVDGGNNALKGAFYATSSADAVTAANAYLAGLGGPVTTHYNMFFLDAKNSERQDLVTVSPVPLPAAGVLMLVALGGLVASRKLRRRADA